MGPRGRPEHPLKVLEILEAPAGKAIAESPAGPGSCIGEGNGNPLQCSCLENPMDGEAW